MALALPLAAQESAPAEKPAATAEQQPAAVATPEAKAVAQADSPLVALSKRANRKGKKPTNVITNESLRYSGSGGHVTTTTNQGTLNMPKIAPPLRPTPEMEAAAAEDARRKQLAAETAAKTKAAEEAQLKRAEAAAAAEDGYDGARDDADEFVGTAPPPL